MRLLACFAGDIACLVERGSSAPRRRARVKFQSPAARERLLLLRAATREISSLACYHARDSLSRVLLHARKTRALRRRARKSPRLRRDPTNTNTKKRTTRRTKRKKKENRHHPRPRAPKTCDCLIAARIVFWATKQATTASSEVGSRPPPCDLDRVLGARARHDCLTP